MNNLLCAKNFERSSLKNTDNSLKYKNVCIFQNQTEEETAECYQLIIVKAHANTRNKSQHCCVLLGVFGLQCHVCSHGPKSLTGSVKLYATSANIVGVPCNRTQHVWLNNAASVCMGL